MRVHSHTPAVTSTVGSRVGRARAGRKLWLRGRAARGLVDAGATGSQQPSSSRPTTRFSKLQLANTFVRQDQLARAVPLLQGLGETERAWAVTYASIGGTPYDVHGADRTNVPFPALDPLPYFELSVNGMKPQRFIFDTGGAGLVLMKETAQRAGLRGLATSHTWAAGQQLTVTHGVAGEIRIGEVELRNVPVTWPDQMRTPVLPDGTPPAGFVGNEIFYRFLTTLDYAGRSLVLRDIRPIGLPPT
jgi:hypothetical protein